MVTVRAIYENGKLRLLDKIELEEGREITVMLMEEPPKNLGKRTPNLHRGVFEMSDDFDDPLPDEFWLGEDK